MLLKICIDRNYNKEVEDFALTSFVFGNTDDVDFMDTERTGHVLQVKFFLMIDLKDGRF